MEDNKLPDNSENSNDRLVISLLQDTLDHCEADDYQTLIDIVRSKFEKLKKPLTPQSEFLKLRLPNLGENRNISNTDFDELRLSIIKKGLSVGIPEAEYHYACYLYEGKNYSDAIKLYKNSADNGYPPSQHCYGLDLFYGIGDIPANKKEGLKYLSLAAGQLYDLSIEFFIELYREDNSHEGKDKFELYTRMLSWSKM
ncbi:MAG: hypothetical protein ABJN22_02425 [Litorimonas sp.]